MEPVVVDNLCNSKAGVLTRVAAISGREPRFYEGTSVTRPCWIASSASSNIDAMIHFAAPRGGRRVDPHPAGLLREQPERHPSIAAGDETGRGTQFGVQLIDTVYGDPASTPIREDFPGATNPYGRSIS